MNESIPTFRIALKAVDALGRTESYGMEEVTLREGSIVNVATALTNRSDTMDTVETRAKVKVIRLPDTIVRDQHSEEA